MTVDKLKPPSKNSYLMNKEKFRTILDAAVQKGITEIPSSFEHRQLYPGHRQLETEPQIEDDLKQFLRADTAISSVFDDKMFYTGNGGTTVPLSHLIQWLLKRVNEHDSKVAADNLERYLSTWEVPGQDVLVISGISLFTPVDLGNGLKLLPFDHLVNSFRKAWVEGMAMGRSGLGMPILEKAVLTCPNKMMRKQQGRPDFTPKFLELEQARQWLTLIGPSCPLQLAYWWEPEEWVPLAGMTGSISGHIHDVMHGPGRIFDETDMEKAKTIFRIISDIDDGLKTRLSIPLNRLNQSIRRMQSVDSAIELGIALEALFFDDGTKSSELSFKLRLRGAWLLGATHEQRKEVMATLDELYDCRSAAIHSGKLDGIKTHKPKDELLKEGYCLVAQAIESILRKGRFPDWNDLVLG